MEMFILFLPIFIAVHVYQFYTTYKKYQIINGTPTTEIQNIDTGYFEIKGQVSSKSEMLLSPMDQIECVWYCLIIKELVKSGKKHTYSTKANIQKFTKCMLDDGTGTCELDLTHVKFNLNKEHYSQSGILESPTKRQLEMLDKAGLKSTTIVGINKNFQYLEYVLRVGDELYVLGDCVAGISSSDTVTCRGTSQKPIFISDKSEEYLLETHKSEMTKSGVTIFLASIIFAVLILQF